MRGTVRTPVEATPTAPPTAFFPCNLCAYLWPDICLPAAIYGGRDNSNKGWCHHGGLALVRAPFPNGSDISNKAKLFKSFLSCHVAAAAENAVFLSLKKEKGAAASTFCSQTETAAPLHDWRLFVK